MSETVTIIALATHDLPRPSVASVEARCDRCGCGVWLGPSSELLLAKQPGTRVLCARCGLAELRRWRAQAASRN